VNCTSSYVQPWTTTVPSLSLASHPCAHVTRQRRGGVSHNADTTDGVRAHSDLTVHVFRIVFRAPILLRARASPRAPRYRLSLIPAQRPILLRCYFHHARPLAPLANRLSLMSVACPLLVHIIVHTKSSRRFTHRWLTDGSPLAVPASTPLGALWLSSSYSRGGEEASDEASSDKAFSSPSAFIVGGVAPTGWSPKCTSSPAKLRLYRP